MGSGGNSNAFGIYFKILTIVHIINNHFGNSEQEFIFNLQTITPW